MGPHSTTWTRAWLSSSELKQWRESLSFWQTPEEFCFALEELRSLVSNHQMFNDTEISFLRDASTLGDFATLISADEVRISDRRVQFPDGHVRIAGKELEVEIVEADMPERRRGLEYQPGAPSIWDDPVENWDKETDALPAAVKQVIEKKIAKRYQPPPVLVVYVNLGRPSYGHRVDEINEALRSIKRLYSPSFAELYLIWGGRLY